MNKIRAFIPNTSYGFYYFLKTLYHLKLRREAKRMKESLICCFIIASIRSSLFVHDIKNKYSIILIQLKKLVNNLLIILSLILFIILIYFPKYYYI